MYKAIAYQIAEYLDLKNSRETLPGTLIFGNKDELFYELGEHQYCYIFKYGVVCFFNIPEKQQENLISHLQRFTKHPLPQKLAEEIEINTNAEANKIYFNKVSLKSLSQQQIQLVMLNLSQSVALDYYDEASERILADTQKHTTELELHGKLDISGKKLKKYIGKTLNIKNKIAENLYILDSPLVTWDNERLSKLDTALKGMFDITDRYETIKERLEIVKENLDLFKDMLHQRESSILELIIIILILVEVFDMLIAKAL